MRLDTYVAEQMDRQPWATLFDLLRRRRDFPVVPPEQGMAWLARQVVDRVTDKRDAVVVVTGEEGMSKTTCAFRLTEEIGKLTSNKWDPRLLTFNPENVVDAYDLLRRGLLPRASVVTYDEGSEGLLGTDTFDPAQVVLIRLLFRARVVGAILVICIPDIWALAKKVRGRRATYWLDIERRGSERKPAPSVAAVHERDRRRRYKPTSALGLSRSERCPTLTFGPPPSDDALWALWERRKMEDLGYAFDEWRSILKRRRERQERRAVAEGGS